MIGALGLRVGGRWGMVALAAAVALALAIAPAAFGKGRCGTHPWCDTSLTRRPAGGLLVKALTPTERRPARRRRAVRRRRRRAGTHTGTATASRASGCRPCTSPTARPARARARRRRSPRRSGWRRRSTARPAGKAGALVGDEVRKKGNDVVFAPTVDIMRTPLGGRTFEAYGEDPYLSSRIGRRVERGRRRQGVIVNVKHFAGNNQEGYAGRRQPERSEPAARPDADRGQPLHDRASTSARCARSTCALRGGRQEGNVGSIMCSYERLNGTYACQNKPLLDDILRSEWGFKGFVIADYGAAHDPDANLNDGPRLRAVAGRRRCGPANIAAALLAGQVTQATVDERRGASCARCSRTGSSTAPPTPTTPRDRPAGPRARGPEDRRVAASRCCATRATCCRSTPEEAQDDRAHRRRRGGRKGGGGSSNINPFFTNAADRVDPGPGRVRRQDGLRRRLGPRPRGRAREGVRRRDRRRRRLPDRGLGPLLPDARVPDDPRRPGRARSRRSPPRRAPRPSSCSRPAGRCSRPWREKVAGLVEAWYPGRVRRPGDRERAVRRRRPGRPAARDVPAVRGRPADGRRRRASTRAWPSASTTSRACSSATAGTTRSAR